MFSNNNAAKRNKIEIGQMLCRNCATEIQSLPLPAPEPESEILECSDIDDEDAGCMDVGDGSVSGEDELDKSIRVEKANEVLLEIGESLVKRWMVLIQRRLFGKKN